MTREINTSQAARWASPNISPVTFAVVTFYSDKRSETVEDTLYLSTHPVTYDYGAVGTWRVFHPFIAAGDDFETAISHVPKPYDGNFSVQSYDLHLTNSMIGSTRLSTYLSGYNIHGATIEISQILLSDDELLSNRGPIQLLTWEGDEHLVLFRGVVKRLTNISLDRLTIESQVDLRTKPTPWVYASDESITDPLDLGKRYPWVYGRAYRIPCINYQVGWVTTLVEDLDDSETGAGYKISDGSGFPTASFTARIDGEEMTCSNGAATTMTIGTRGTPATAHTAGALVSEILSSTVIVLNGSTTATLNALYVVNPLNDQLVRLDSAASYWPTLSLSSAPSTATFSASKLSDLMDALRLQAQPAGEITTQAEYTDPLDEIRIRLVTQKNATGGINDNTDLPYGNSEYSTFCNYVAIYEGWRLESTSSSADEDGRWFWIPEGLLSNTSRSIYRYRFVAVVDYDADSGAALDFWFNWDFAGETGATYNRVGAGSSTVDGTAFVSDWSYPTSMTVGDLDRATTPSASDLGETLAVYFNPAGTPDGNGYFDIRSIELVVELVDANLTRNTPAVSSSGAATGFGLRFYADLDGIPAPSVGSAYTTIEDFESGTYSASNCTAATSATNPYEGTYSLALTWDADAQATSEPFDTDVADGWAGTNCSAALTASEGHRLSSSYAVEGAAASAQEDSILYWDTFASTVVEDFESGTWANANCVAAIDATNPKSGTYSLSLTHDVDAEHDGIAFSTNAVTGWTTSGPTTVSYETGLGHTEGSGCIKGVVTGGTSVHAIFSPIFAAKDMRTEAADGTGRVGFAVDVKMYFNGASAPASLEIKFMDSSKLEVFRNQFAVDSYTDDTWHTVICSYDARSYEALSKDPTQIRYVSFLFARVAPAGLYILVDNPRWIRTNCVAQNNAVGVVDMSTSDNAYAIEYYCGGNNHSNQPPNSAFEGEAILDATMWLSSATWSGTTLGTDYYKIPIAPTATLGAWQSIRSEAPFFEAGTFTDTTVRSMRLVAHNQEGVYLRDPTIVHYFDDLSVAALLTGPSADMSGESIWSRGRMLVMFDFKIKKGGSSGGIEFRVGTDADTYYQSGAVYSTNDFTEDTWVTMVVDPRTWAMVNYPNYSDINYFAVVFNKETRSATAKVYLDNVKLVYQNSIAQNNAVGGKDYSSYQDSYRLTMYLDGDLATASIVRMIVASDTWSDTTLGADYFRGSFNPYDLVDSFNTTWLQGASHINGGADMTDINTSRWICTNAVGIYSRDPTTIHYIDALIGNNPELTYLATTGNVMLHPSDIMQHWISVVGGDELLAGTSGDLVSRLGSGAIWGFDARTLGFNWDEVLQRMAYEARCHVVPVDRPGGRYWRFLAASANYGFGDTEVTLTETSDAVDLGHSIDDIATDFRFLYAFDASYPGSGSDSGYRKALFANVDTSDVPISTLAITQAAQRYGYIDADTEAFRCIQDDDTAAEIAGYYVQERIMTYPHSIVTLWQVSWMEAISLEVGDVVFMTLPWEVSQRRFRITGMTKRFNDQTWTLTAVSVRYSGEKT